MKQRIESPIHNWVERDGDKYYFHSEVYDGSLRTEVSKKFYEVFASEFKDYNSQFIHIKDIGAPEKIYVRYLAASEIFGQHAKDEGESE